MEYTSGCNIFTLLLPSEVSHETTAISKRNMAVMQIKTPTRPMVSFPANWLTSDDRKDVCPAARLQLFIGQETNQHCQNILFFGK